MRLAMVGTEIEGPSDVAGSNQQFKVGKSVQWGVLQAEWKRVKSQMTARRLLYVKWLAGIL